MWTRSDIKALGRTSFRRNYWPSVAAGLFLTLSSGGSSGGGARGVHSTSHDLQEMGDTLSHMQPDERTMVILSVVLAASFVVVLVCFLDVLVLNPLAVGCRHFFLTNLREPASVGEIVYGFRRNYGRNVLTMFLSDIFIFLWSLLFVIPGFIKHYSYMLVPYLLEDHPELSATEIITLSRKMMDGQKMNAFLLDVSFIGWWLAAFFTCGLAGLFYAWPYMGASKAAMYEAIRADYGSYTTVY